MTVPMMSPVIFYTLVLGVVEVLRYFLVPFVLKQGTASRPGRRLLQPVHLPDFFTFQDMSYGATLAWVLFRHLPGHHAGPVLCVERPTRSYSPAEGSVRSA